MSLVAVLRQFGSKAQGFEGFSRAAEAFGVLSLFALGGFRVEVYVTVTQ